MQQRCAFQIGESISVAFAWFVIRDVYTDREGADNGTVVLAQDGKMFPVHARLHHPVYRLQEVVAVSLHVEADEIGPQQTIHQLTLPRTDAKGLRVRPRDVPEDRHTRIRPLLFDQPRQQSEVIILDQNHRAGYVSDFFQHGVGELAVNLLVVLPVGGTEDGAGVRNMTEWPETLVGKTVVVAFLFLLVQPHAS